MKRQQIGERVVYVVVKEQFHMSLNRERLLIVRKKNI